jgi:hypothetical protein
MLLLCVRYSWCWWKATLLISFLCHKNFKGVIIMADKEKNPVEIEKEIKLIEARTKTAKEQVSRMVGK